MTDLYTKGRSKKLVRLLNLFFKAKLIFFGLFGPITEIGCIVFY